jgi:hypothetical protein
MSAKLKNKRTSDHHSPVENSYSRTGGYSGQSYAIVDYGTTNLASGAVANVSHPSQRVGGEEVKTPEGNTLFYGRGTVGIILVPSPLV